MIRKEDKIRLYKSSIIPEGCWLWTGSLNTSGYGQFGMGGRNITAHRASYLLSKGPIKRGLLVLHKCDIKICINPEHLYLGTQLENMHDALRRKRHRNQKKIHCKRGHEFTPENTRIDTKGGRQCCKCDKIRSNKI